MSDRLKTRLWVQALLRRCDIRAVPAMVVRSGDVDAGAVLVKLNRGEAGCEIFAQTRDRDGNPAWMRALPGGSVPEDAADSYIARAVKIDSDLWVIEIEDRAGRVPLDEPIVT